MTIFLTVIGLLVLIALGTIIGISFSFAYFVTHPSCDTLDANREKLIRLDESLWDFYLNVPKEDWNISSYDGYLLHGNFLCDHNPRIHLHQIQLHPIRQNLLSDGIQCIYVRP